MDISASVESGRGAVHRLCPKDSGRSDYNHRREKAGRRSDTSGPWETSLDNGSEKPGS